jgi:hypothetical protein
MIPRWLNLEGERLDARIAKIAESDRPVIAGPFTGEVGFELLYWIPLLRRAVEIHPELRERMTVVSRGGTRPWTRDLATGYADVYKHALPRGGRSGGEPTKATTISARDRKIVEWAGRREGLDRPVLLHPSVFYRTYHRVRRDDPYAFARLARPSKRGAKGLFSSYRPLPHPGLREDIELPERFAAVRFYSRPSFPDESATRELVRRVVAGLGKQMPVVLCHHGRALDEHVEFEIEAGGAELVRLPEKIPPAQNLAVQSAVIARAEVFAGTYGGLSYLAPFYGVPSIAFNPYPEHTLPWHLELAQKVFSSPRFGSLLVLGPGQLELAELVAGGTE